MQVLESIFENKYRIFKLYKEKLENESNCSVTVYSKDLSDFGISNLSKDSSINEGSLNLDIEEERKHEISYRKFDITDFERLDLIENITFIEPKENRTGNYSNYIERALKTIKIFDRIDFTPLIKKKSIALPNKFDKRITLVIDLDETLIHYNESQSLQ